MSTQVQLLPPGPFLCVNLWRGSSVGQYERLITSKRRCKSCPRNQALAGESLMPGSGPSLLFDKSVLQSLSVDEAVWLDTFYFPCITPLFFTETLADLEKEVQKGRSPEDVVGNLAQKTPIGGAINIHHHT